MWTGRDRVYRVIGSVCRLVPTLSTLTSVIVAGGACAQERGIERSEPGPGPVFVITGGDSTLHRQTVDILQSAQREMSVISGVGLSDTIRVVYVSRAQSFDSVIGGRFPDWGAACAIGEDNLIAARSPLDHPIGRELAEILRHELAHLHLDQMAGLHQVPRWMHEGYAQQFAHQWQYGDDWVIARAAFADQLIPLRDIDGVNSFRDASARLAYAESYLAMRLFLDKYGWDGLHLFASRLRDGGDWDEAFFAATGATYAGFQEEVASYLTGQYNWIAFFGDTVLLWIALTVAFVVLYVIKMRRAAVKRSEWEQQEAIEDILYAPFGRPTDPPRS